MELVSVIIPAYNAEKTLQETLLSVCRQTYQNLEIMIVDDGSSDMTYETAKYVQSTDGRIVVRHTEHAGVSNARNTALRFCHGTFAAFVDADDIMDETMIENLVRCMERDVDLVCCGYQVRNEAGKVLFKLEPAEGIWTQSKLYQGIAVLQDKKCLNMLWNKLFRTDIIRKNGLEMDRQVSMGEDFLFVIDYLQKCRGRICVIAESSYYYTLSAGGLQAAKKKEENLSCRLKQLARLQEWYNMRKYPLDGIYREMMRCFYTSVMEAENPVKIAEQIYQTEEYSVLCGITFQGGMKYRVFLELMRFKNTRIMILAVRMFRFFKVVCRKTFRW